MVGDRARRDAAASRVASWTAEEVDVLRAVALGLPASVVAEHRRCTLAEVGTVLVTVRTKAAVTSTQAAVALAREAGLLD